jgi:hypothetical protein
MNVEFQFSIDWEGGMFLIYLTCFSVRLKCFRKVDNAKF